MMTACVDPSRGPQSRSPDPPGPTGYVLGAPSFFGSRQAVAGVVADPAGRKTGGPQPG